MAVNDLGWFPFYVNDWLLSRSVRRMSHEQKGVYFDLLCIAWRDGGIPGDLEEIAVDLGMPADRLAAIWPRIGAMFVPDGDRDMLVNPRMEEIRTEQNAKRAVQAEKGRKSGEARRQAAMNRGSTADDPQFNQEKKAEESREEEKPEGGAPAPAPSRTAAMVELLPESHRTEEMHDAIQGYFRMRTEYRHGAWKPSTMSTHAREWAELPPEAVIAALKHSTAATYRAVFPKEFLPGGKHGPRLLSTNGGNQGPRSVADRYAEVLGQMGEEDAA